MVLLVGKSGNGDRSEFPFHQLYIFALQTFSMYMYTYTKIEKIFPFSSNFAISFFFNMPSVFLI